MKLWDLPQRVTKMRDIVEIWGLEPNGDKDGIIIFDHLDGMYSYCYVKGHPDQVVHLSASTPLKKIDGHYVIDRTQDE